MVASLDGRLNVIRDVDAVRAMVEQRLRWVRGEWFLQVDEGVPYRTIFGSVNREENVILELLTHVRRVAGVANATALDYRYDGRSLTVSIMINTGDGDFVTEFVA